MGAVESILGRIVRSMQSIITETSQEFNGKSTKIPGKKRRTKMEDVGTKNGPEFIYSMNSCVPQIQIFELFFVSLSTIAQDHKAMANAAK